MEALAWANGNSIADTLANIPGGSLERETNETSRHVTRIVILMNGKVKRYYYGKNGSRCESPRPSMISEAASKSSDTFLGRGGVVKGGGKEFGPCKCIPSAAWSSRKCECAPEVNLSAMHPVNREFQETEPESGRQQHKVGRGEAKWGIGRR